MNDQNLGSNATGYPGEMAMATRPQADQGGYNAPATPPSDNRAKVIAIQQLGHGFLVEVGCQRFAIETKHKLLDQLDRYLTNPTEVENQWLSGRLKF